MYTRTGESLESVKFNAAGTKLVIFLAKSPATWIIINTPAGTVYSSYSKPTADFVTYSDSLLLGATNIVYTAMKADEGSLTGPTDGRW